MGASRGRAAERGIRHALTAILRNVQGTEREPMIRADWESGRLQELDDQLLAETLPLAARWALGRIHPALIEGESLPGYRRGESPKTPERT